MFPFDTEYISCKDKHLHIPKLHLVNPYEESPLPRSEVGVLDSTHRTVDINENQNRLKGVTKG